MDAYIIRANYGEKCLFGLESAPNQQIIQVTLPSKTKPQIWLSHSKETKEIVNKF